MRKKVFQQAFEDAEIALRAQDRYLDRKADEAISKDPVLSMICGVPIGLESDGYIKSPPDETPS